MPWGRYRLKSKKILLTGATGFIGQRLHAVLRASDYDIRVLGRTRPENAQDFYDWELSQPLDVAALDSIDTVFHLAGKAHALSSDYHDEVAYFPINIAATRQLLEAARHAGVRRFVYFSSVKATGYHCVGTGGMAYSDESCDELPESMYGRSKRMAELLVLDGGFVPEPVVIRPSMVYGNTIRGNLPKMILAIRNRHFPPLPDTGNHRSFVHVEDLVRAAMLAAVHPAAAGNIYIVTDGKTYSTRQIYEWISEALGRSVPGWVVPLPVLKMLGSVGDLIGKMKGRRFVFDHDALNRLVGSEVYCSAKIERELGFRAQHALHESLPEIVDYIVSVSR